MNASHMAMDPIMRLLRAAACSRPIMAPIFSRYLDVIAERAEGPYDISAGTLWSNISGSVCLQPTEEISTFQMLKEFMRTLIKQDLLSYTPTPPGIYKTLQPYH